MKVLILGGNGLLGNALLNILSKNYEVIATTRNKLYKDIKNFIYVDDLTRLDFLDKLIIDVDPDIIINALSVRDVGNKKLYQLKLIFTVIPHHISSFCRRLNKRFIQISTDGVFSGKTGNYKEEDIPDPIDSYGICKFLGEPNQKNTTVIRTSMIGHSFNNDYGLLDWFIKQNECTLYKNAVFSGLPVYEIARIISQYFIENNAKVIKVLEKNCKKICRDNEFVIIFEKAINGLDRKFQIKPSIIFIDPPYEKEDINFNLLKILKNKIILKNTFIVLETSREEKLIIPKEFNFLKEKNYGKTIILFLN